MSNLPNQFSLVNIHASVTKSFLCSDIRQSITANNYQIVEENLEKPWGGYFRIDGNDADNFITDFFPTLNPLDARLGNPDAELSPKILIVAPNQRLSWQYHARRAERWTFLSDGSYYKSLDDEQGSIHPAKAGQVVQFQKEERHRLVASNQWTLVAEIWQHTDKKQLSDEDDITRIQDDYSR